MSDANDPSAWWEDARAHAARLAPDDHTRWWYTMTLAYWAPGLAEPNFVRLAVAVHNACERRQRLPVALPARRVAAFVAARRAGRSAIGNQKSATVARRLREPDGCASPEWMREAVVRLLG